MTTQVLDNGSLIRLEGLIKGVHLNGCTGTILDYDSNKVANGNEEKKNESSSFSSEGRYQVELNDDNGGKVVLVKSENVVPISFAESMALQGFHILECTPSFLDTCGNNNNVILGGGSHIPSEHVDFLPRRAELPTRKFTFYNDVAKECFVKLHDEGDFVAAWKFVREDETKKFLEFQFGLKKDDDDNRIFKNNNMLKRGPFLLMVRLNAITIPLPGASVSSSSSGAGDPARELAALTPVSSELGVEQEDRIVFQTGINSFVAEFAEGCPTDTLDQLAHRALHHVLRQHGASLPCDMTKHLYSGYTVATNTKKVKKNKLLEYLDIQVVRADIEASVQGFTYSDRLSAVGEALEALEEYELAGRIYIRAAEKFHDFAGLNPPWKLYMNGGIAYRRAKMSQPSEQNYIKALQCKYQQDGSRLLIDDPDFRLLMSNMISMYSFFAVEEDMNDQPMVNCPLLGILCTLLHVSGFASLMGSLAPLAHVKALKPQYRRSAAARTVLRDAIQISTTSVDAFRSKILDCMVGSNKSQYFLHRSFLGDDSCGSARDSARGVIQSICRQHTSQEVMHCCRPGCETHDISDRTTSAADGGGKLMQCPCRTVVYCGKECQTAHWREHKKVCPLKKKKAQEGKEQSE